MINDLLTRLIDAALQARKDPHGWDAGTFADLLRLPIDQRGRVGEKLIAAALQEGGVQNVTRAGDKNRRKKQWDIRTADMTIEVKTATLGRNAVTFQHERIEKNRQWDALALLDIAPNDVYLSWATHESLDWHNMHRRDPEGYHKKDLRLADLESGNLPAGLLASGRILTVADVVAGYNTTKQALQNED